MPKFLGQVADLGFEAIQLVLQLRWNAEDLPMVSDRARLEAAGIRRLVLKPAG